MSNEEKCSECKEGILQKTYFDEYDKKVKEFTCGHVLKIVVVNEQVHFKEEAIVSAGLYFELTEAVSVSGIKKNSNKIELVFDDKNSNMLKGFKISIQNLEGKHDILKSYHTAFRLTNLISLKTGMFIFHKRPREIIDGKISDKVFGFGMDVILTKLVNLDMTDNGIDMFLNSDSKIGQHVAHYVNGQKALKDSSFIEAIKEFYQIIEYEDIPSLSKYKFLRDGISHSELTISNTIEKLKTEFNIVCIENPNSKLTPKGKYVDITSPAIQEILEKEAKFLREEVIRMVDSELDIQTN